VKWGGDWTGFVDKPHYKLATGKTVTEFVPCPRMATVRLILECGSIQVGRHSAKFMAD